MGGEWYFYFKTQETSPLDQGTYQELLLELKAKYGDKFKPEHVKWCDVTSLPPPDNIFARFKFDCTSHTSWEPEHPWFNLYWTLDPESYNHKMDGSLHGYCSGPGDFDDLALLDIHCQIVETFPKHFVLYREWVDLKAYDSKKKGWIYYDDYYLTRSLEDDPTLDFAACDKDDCGYCGRCWY